MAKVKWAVASRARRKRILKQAKGYRGARRLHLLKVKETLMRAKAYRTRDRKTRKRQYKSLWVMRLNAAARERGLTYSRLMHTLRQTQVRLNRKQLSELALTDPAAFDQLVGQTTTD
ncbi:MAG: 50S ribosomal protein L20 [Candidatus Omnitrophica bacterium]|nr:50S ribosomal protein L20 [Candidatus Omnitrophota bacterium]